MRHFAGRLLAPIVVIVLAFPGASLAQILSHDNLPTTSSQQSPDKGPQPKNLLTLAELNALDVKFHKEMDTAQDAFDREAFTDAEQGFAQLAQEIDDTIRKIAASPLQKNGFLEIDGVKKPATTQTETEWFTRILDKVKRKKDASALLLNVTDTQKQAMALMTAGKYPDDLEAYRKSLQALIQNRALLDDATLQFFSSRSENGQKQSITDYWGAKFRALRDKYNRTTEEPKMSQEEIHATIKAVADEITTQGYTDAAKFPEMPEDARSLFVTLLSAANQYLTAQ